MVALSIYIHYISIDNKTLVATGSVKENSSLDWRALVATNTRYLTIKTVIKYRTELQQATFANINLTFLLIILKQNWAENRPHFTFTLRFLSTVKTTVQLLLLLSFFPFLLQSDFSSYLTCILCLLHHCTGTRSVVSGGIGGSAVASAPLATTRPPREHEGIHAVACATVLLRLCTLGFETQRGFGGEKEHFGKHHQQDINILPLV